MAPERRQQVVRELTREQIQELTSTSLEVLRLKAKTMGLDELSVMVALQCVLGVVMNQLGVKLDPEQPMAESMYATMQGYLKAGRWPALLGKKRS